MSPARYRGQWVGTVPDSPMGTLKVVVLGGDRGILDDPKWSKCIEPTWIWRFARNDFWSEFWIKLNFPHFTGSTAIPAPPWEMREDGINFSTWAPYKESPRPIGQSVEKSSGVEGVCEFIRLSLFFWSIHDLYSLLEDVLTS